MSLDFTLKATLDLGGPEPFEIEIESFNITHNLGSMARACGLYQPLWRPDEYFPEPSVAKDLIEPIRSGLKNLLSDPEHYRTFNPVNGWGKYEDLVDFTCQVLSTIRKYPLCSVSVSR